MSASSATQRLGKEVIGLHKHRSNGVDTDSGDDYDEHPDYSGIEKFFSPDNEGLFLNFPNFKENYPKEFRNVHRHLYPKDPLPIIDKIPTDTPEIAARNLDDNEERIKTFDEVPDLRKPAIYTLHGLYYTGHANYVRCFYCKSVTTCSNQHSTMDVITTHIRLDPNCPKFFDPHCTINEKLLYSSVRRTMSRRYTKYLIHCFARYPTLAPSHSRTVTKMQKLVPQLLELLAKYSSSLLDEDCHNFTRLTDLVTGNEPYKMYFCSTITSICETFSLAITLPIQSILEQARQQIQTLCPIEVIVEQDIQMISLLCKCITCLRLMLNGTYMTDPRTITIVKDCQKNVARLRRPIVDQHDQYTCAVCLDNEATYTMDPCGHSICPSCQPRINNCHKCRQTIMKFIKRY